MKSGKSSALLICRRHFMRRHRKTSPQRRLTEKFHGLYRPYFLGDFSADAVSFTRDRRLSSNSPAQSAGRIIVGHHRAADRLSLTVFAVLSS